MAEVEVYGCPLGPEPCEEIEVMINPVDRFLGTEGPQNLTATPLGGTWSGDVSTDGVFDPSQGTGIYSATYTYTEGECTISVSTEIIVNPADCISPNLALDRPSSQSSLYGTGEALYANDGNRTGTIPWGSEVDLQHTAVGEYQPWWQVELIELSQLLQIEIYNRTNGLESRLNNFYILISNEPFAPGATLASLLDDPDITAVYFEGAAGLQESFAVDVNGRYVRVQLSGTGILHMAEVEVYGCPLGSDPCEDIEVAIDDVGPFLDTDEIQNLTATPLGGIWSGDVSSEGTFDPSQGVGTYTVTYTYTEGECTESASIEILVNSETTCNGTTNLALNQPSTQSSTYGTGEAFYANDGDLAGTVPWGAFVNLQHTAVGGNQPWWQVDLGEVSQLERIDIYNRTNGLESRLNNFYVLISEEAFPVGASLASLLEDENVTAVFFDGPAGLEENFPVEVNGRYVRIQLSETGILHMAEVEVYGCPLGNSGKNFVQGKSNEMDIYPNPASNEVSISFKTPLQLNDVLIFDITGRLVKTIPSAAVGESLDVQELDTGVYFLKAVDQNGETYQESLIIKKE